MTEELCERLAKLVKLSADIQAKIEKDDGHIITVYDKLHEGKLGAHWLWVVIEQIAAGVPEDEAMRQFGYYERAAAPAEGAAWQPIETAPKDCTEILAWVKEVGGAMVLMYFSSLKRWGDGITNDSWTPTHWAPLPAAPKEKP